MRSTLFFDYDCKLKCIQWLGKKFTVGLCSKQSVMVIFSGNDVAYSVYFDYDCNFNFSSRNPPSATRDRDRRPIDGSSSYHNPVISTVIDEFLYFRY